MSHSDSSLDSPQQDTSSEPESPPLLYFHVHTLYLAPLSISLAENVTSGDLHTLVTQLLEKQDYPFPEEDSQLAHNSHHDSTLDCIQLCYLTHSIPHDTSTLCDHSATHTPTHLPLSTREDEPIPLYVRNPRTAPLVHQLLEFMHNDELTTLTLERDPLERKFLHALAAECCLHHQSKKSNDNPRRKFIQLKKGNKFERYKHNPLKERINRRIKLHKKVKHQMGPSEILDGWLFLGSGNDLHGMSGVHRVLNCTADWQTPQNLETHVEYKRLNLLDQHGENIRAFFDEAVEFIDRSAQDGKKTLVHCVIGKSRSASIIIAYLMKRHQWSLKEAHDYVRERREIIRPNNDFLQQLQEYEMELFGLEQPTLHRHQLSRPLYLEVNQSRKRSRKNFEEDAKLQEITTLLDKLLPGDKEHQELMLKVPFEYTNVKQTRDLLVALHNVIVQELCEKLPEEERLRVDAELFIKAAKGRLKQKYMEQLARQQDSSLGNEKE